jgi:abequosyltransferase
LTQPLLSICIATMNRATCIGATLNCLIEQLTEDVEILVLDGGSNDGTQGLLLEYAPRCPQLRYVRQDAAQGVDRDFDRAVELAAGQYCWLMSDDDLLKSGGLARVLGVLKRDPSLVIVNAEVRTFDFSKQIVPRRLRFTADREYGPEEISGLFADTGVYMSFIGCVVIRRDVWMQRERRAYYGSLFIHMGVIFQERLPSFALVLADPLITIRLGNSFWAAREFDVAMFKWPSLVWGLCAPSDQAKAAVSTREPWKELPRLVLYRAKGSYSLSVYLDSLRSKDASAWEKLAAQVVALMPGALINAAALFYLVCIRSDSAPGENRLGIYDLRHSRYYWRNWFRGGRLA